MTDDEVHIPADMRDKFNAWKVTEKARLITLLIGSIGGGAMKTVSDEVFSVPRIGIDNEGIERCLSI